MLPLKTKLEDLETENLLPIGLAKGAKLLNDIKRGRVISYHDVKLNEGSFKVILRRLQDKLERKLY